MTWVKFHQELTKGAKRGIKRAHRFVFMELSLEARELGGFIELPVGMSDVDGVCDLLGGDSREVRDALSVLTTGPDPMLRFEGEPGRRRLVVVSWNNWNDRPGASSERVRRFRERRETEMKRVTRNGSETDVTEHPPDSDRFEKPPRVEKRREEDPPVVPHDGPEPDSLPGTPILTPAEPATPKRSRKAERGSGCVGSVDAGASSWLQAHQIPPLDSDVGAEVAKFLDHHRGKGSVQLDWAATWRTWVAGWDRYRPHEVGPAPGHGPGVANADEVRAAKADAARRLREANGV